MPSPKLTALTEEERAELATWVAKNGESLPEPVRTALEQHSALLDGLLGSRHKLSQVLVELRRALGITAMSERRTSGNPLGPLSQGEKARPKGKRQRLELDAERSETLSAWHKALARRHRSRVKAFRDKLMKLPVDLDPELSEYANAADELEAIAEAREQTVRFKLGGGAQPAFESAREAFITGAQVTTVEETVSLPSRCSS